MINGIHRDKQMGRGRAHDLRKSCAWTGKLLVSWIKTSADAVLELETTHRGRPWMGSPSCGPQSLLENPLLLY